MNRAGGLLCIWRRWVFNLQETVVGNGYIGLIGLWGAQSLPWVIVNVYSPCNLEDKRRLWAELLDWRTRGTITTWCMACDFNAIRNVEERRGVAEVSTQSLIEMEEFNLFLDHMEVMDIPLL